MAVGLPQATGALLAGGPRGRLTVHTPSGPVMLGPADRKRQLSTLTVLEGSF